MTETVAPPHPFDAAVGLTPLTAGLSTGETNPAYNNMVGPFGGVTAATLLESVLKHPERLGDPLSLTVNFAGPITEGASRSPPGRCAPTARRSTGPSNCLRTEPSPLPRRQCSVPGVKPGRLPRSRCRKFRRPKTLRCCRSPSSSPGHRTTRCALSKVQSPTWSRASIPTRQRRSGCAINRHALSTSRR